MVEKGRKKAKKGKRKKSECRWLSLEHASKHNRKTNKHASSCGHEHVLLQIAFRTLCERASVWNRSGNQQLPTVARVEPSVLSPLPINLPTFCPFYDSHSLVSIIIFVLLLSTESGKLEIAYSSTTSLWRRWTAKIVLACDLWPEGLWHLARGTR